MNQTKVLVAGERLEPGDFVYVDESGTAYKTKPKAMPGVWWSEVNGCWMAGSRPFPIRVVGATKEVEK